MLNFNPKQILPFICLSFMAVNGFCDDFRPVVEQDWILQEERWGRNTSHAEAIADAISRGEELFDDLTTQANAPDIEEEIARFHQLRNQAQSVQELGENARRDLYNRIRWIVRDAALKNPLIASKPIAFMKRKRFICQMLHEYLGYFYDYQDISGGSLCILDNPGHSFAHRDLIQGRLPKGNFTTLSLSFDAKTLYFAFAKRADSKPNYYSAERQGFHIYAMDHNGENLRQLTDGLYDDFDPCELPDGDIAFMSTRRAGFGRCHNPWEPLPTYTLHRMNADGSAIRTLSFHETNEWHPSVLRDGRIVYTRWDYVDRSAAHFHGLWVSNPDGTNPSALFGTYTQQINACYQPKAIPGSNKIMFIAGAHHADVGGSLLILDPSRVSLNPQTGEDELSSVEPLTPEVCYPEAPGWPANYFHSPWPLSENYYLVSFSFDPLPGMGPQVNQDTETGIYWMDRFGNMELLYREDGLSCMYPIPLSPREVPPIVPSVLDSNFGNEGEFLLANVYQSHFPLPESRPIRQLRIFQILPKSETHVANDPRLGYANAESARTLLGSVPVEDDGSAYFRAPAKKPLAFQAVDESGKAVYTMRSVTYLQPGERRGCVGCHETPGTASSYKHPIAFQRKPSNIQSGPDGSNPWSFPRLMQPLLDRHCMSCHDGSEKSHLPNLAGVDQEPFTISYNSLQPYVRWNEWGDKSIDNIVTRPGHMPSDLSPLVQILEDANHQAEVHLSNEEWRRLYLWLDGNAAFYGSYSKAEQLAQRNNEAIPLPKLQ